jgi:hypothetical protein
VCLAKHLRIMAGGTLRLAVQDGDDGSLRVPAEGEAIVSEATGDGARFLARLAESLELLERYPVIPEEEGRDVPVRLTDGREVLRQHASEHLAEVPLQHRTVQTTRIVTGRIGLRLSTERMQIDSCEAPHMANNIRVSMPEVAADLFKNSAPLPRVLPKDLVGVAQTSDGAPLSRQPALDSVDAHPVTGDCACGHQGDCPLSAELRVSSYPRVRAYDNRLAPGKLPPSINDHHPSAKKSFAQVLTGHPVGYPNRWVPRVRI